MQPKFLLVSAAAMFVALSTVSGRAETIAAPSAATVDGTASAGRSTRIDDSAPGWTRSGMVRCDDPAAPAGGHAGGPGAYAAYTFHGASVRIFGLTGSDVIVDGVRHKLGKLAVSIDGHLKSTVSLSKAALTTEARIAEIDGLSNSNHVVELRPRGGWAVIDYMTVDDESGDDAVDSGGPSGQSVNVLTDPLVDLSHVSDRSANWSIDTTNGQFFNGKGARAARTRNTREFLEYRHAHLTSFRLRVYMKTVSELANDVAVYVSVDGVYQKDPVAYRRLLSADGGSGGGWTAIDLGPDGSLPDGADAIAVVFNPGAGPAWEPQLAYVALYAVPSSASAR